jgi:hypothetical protein
MASQGTALQTQNSELVKCIEELREKREVLNRSIREEESEKAKIQQDLQVRASSVLCLVSVSRRAARVQPDRHRVSSLAFVVRTPHSAWHDAAPANMAGLLSCISRDFCDQIEPHASEAAASCAAWLRKSTCALTWSNLVADADKKIVSNQRVLGTQATDPL